MKIKYFKGLLITAIAFGFSACSDFLDVVPDDSPTVEIIFENRVSAEKYLATCYRYLPSAGNYSDPSKLGGDEVWINQELNRSRYQPAPFEIAKGLLTPSNAISNAYLQNYQGIRDCNTFLEKIHLPYDLTERERKQWIAEVKVLKAFYHFQLIRRYGPIIIVRDNDLVGKDEQLLTKERNSVDDAINYCIELLDEALPYLSNKAESGFIESSKISKVVGYAMKAKILVTSASPLFNGNEYYRGFVNSENKEFFNTTYSPEKWVLAKEACKEAVDVAHEEGFSLYQFELPVLGGEVLSDETKLKYTIIGSLTEKGQNTEKIWARSDTYPAPHDYMCKMNDPLGTISQFAQTSVSQAISPSLRMANLFYSKNGVPIEQDVTYPYSSRYNIKDVELSEANDIKFGYKTINLHCNREARFYANLGFDGALYQGYGRFDPTRTWVAEMKAGRAGGYNGIGKLPEYSATGYLVRKVINIESSHFPGSQGFNGVAYSWPLIRLADLYLMYAEALNEVDGPTAECYEYIDKVRSRAGLNGVVDSWTNFAANASLVSEKEGLRDIIHQERLIELAFEGHRFWDLRRWKKSVSMMNHKPIMGWNVKAGLTGSYYSLTKVGEQRFSERDYLWPLPLPVLLNNTSLKQNPDW